MSTRCAFGLHSWSDRPTARPGTTVYRCRRCGLRRLTHGGRKRTRKRFYAGSALIVSAAIWFVSYNLIVHGRTRVIHTLSAAVDRLELAASRGRAALHRAQGDSGAYVHNEE